MKQHKGGEAIFIKTLQIQDVLLMSSEHKVYSLFVGQNLSLDFDKIGEINLAVADDFIVFEIEASLQIKDNKTDELLLKSTAKFASIYSFDKKTLEKDVDNINDFALNFFQYSAIVHILAYVREYFYTVVGKSGYPRLTIPLIKSRGDEEAEIAASDEMQKYKK